MKILSKLLKKKSDKVSIILNSKGKHFIGGKADSKVKIPKLETSPVIYFGYISKSEKHLPILDFDLHLICPLFLDLQDPIFFDYTNPLKPIIIRENVSSNFDILFDNIPSSAYIEYEKMNFCFDNPMPTKMKIGVHEFEMVPGEIGHCEPANWIQDENVPTCPINGKPMKFLFQLGGVDECKTVKGQEILDKEYLDSYLNFGDGFLYIFYEPESKVIAYLNQIT